MITIENGPPELGLTPLTTGASLGNTVSVAGDESVDPAAFVNTARYRRPDSDVVVEPTVNVADVALATLDHVVP